MNYVGLDISMRSTGFVVIDHDGIVLRHEVIGKTPKERPCMTIEQRIRYYVEVGNTIRSAIVPFGEELDIGVEGYSMHGKGDLTIAPELGGIVRLELLGFGRIHEIPPAALKKFATGKGNAPKDSVMLNVYKRWGVDFGDNNLADAYVLARIALHLHQFDRGGLTVPQKEVLLKLGGHGGPDAKAG